MSSVSQDLRHVDTAFTLPKAGEPCWFAVQTRARHEKKVHNELVSDGISTFLPLVSQVRRWSDRKTIVEFPLFSCYLFVRIVPFAEARVSVLRTPGVLSFVGIQGQGIPIPDTQIEDLRTLVIHGVPMDPYPFLKIGHKVRIRGGCMDGIEGILVAKDGERKVVVSIETIQKSLAVSINGYDIEPV
jgi:transcription antitermination factor NusG